MCLIPFLRMGEAVMTGAHIGKRKASPNRAGQTGSEALEVSLKAQEKVTKERTDWDERENTVRRKRLYDLWLFAVGGQAEHPGPP